MTEHGKEPLLFLDVDGTLIPFRQAKQASPLDVEAARGITDADLDAIGAWLEAT